MLQNPCKTLGFKKNMVYKIPPGGGGKPYPASGLFGYAVQNKYTIFPNQIHLFIVNAPFFYLVLFFTLQKCLGWRANLLSERLTLLAIASSVAQKLHVDLVDFNN